MFKTCSAPVRMGFVHLTVVNNMILNCSTMSMLSGLVVSRYMENTRLKKLNIG